MDDADREEDIHIPTFVEEDVDNYVEQVGKQVIIFHNWYSFSDWPRITLIELSNIDHLDWL